ncbi:MAG: hypothetical protein V4598_13940 [Bdellovibrionota bacterium]
MKSVLIALLLISCSSLRRSEPPTGKFTYSYTDVSGDFRYQREIKFIKKKLVTRTQIMIPSAGSDRIVEKSVTVSQLGSVKDKNGRALVVRPLASEFTVWLEGKKYTSRMQLDTARKAMRVTLDSPEPKWKGQTSVPFPSGKLFCFFSQIPDCLYHNQVLEKSLAHKSQTYDFYVVWDNYPYVQEQLTNVGKNLFSHASIKYDGEPKGRIRYILDVEDQVLLYQFSKSFELTGYSWISQGINMVRPGEEVKTEVEEE